MSEVYKNEIIEQKKGDGVFDRIVDKLKPRFVKRNEAMAALREKSFKDFSDVKIQEVVITRIEKDYREINNYTHELEEHELETVKGTVKIDAPILADDEINLEWTARVRLIGVSEEFLKIMKWRKGETEEDLYSGKNLVIDVIFFDPKTGSSSCPDERDCSSFSFFSDRAEELGLDYWTAKNDYYDKALKSVSEEIKKYIQRYAALQKASEFEFRDLKFDIKAKVSSVGFEEEKNEFINSIRAKKIDAKFLYLLGGAEKFLEILNNEEYALSSKEIEIIVDNLDEIENDMHDILYDLGSGNGNKLKPVVEEKVKNKNVVEYHPVDIAPDMVFEAANNMPAGVIVSGELFDFTKPFKDKVARDKNSTFVLFGNTLGNGDIYYQVDLLKNIGNVMNEGDNLFVGVQLNFDFEKIVKMYQSEELRNFVLPMVREMRLGADEVEIDVYGDEVKRVVNIDLKILKDKKVEIGGEEIKYKKGNIINVAVSQKYEIEDMGELVKLSGLEIKNTFLDNDKTFAIYELVKI